MKKKFFIVVMMMATMVLAAGCSDSNKKVKGNDVTEAEVIDVEDPGKTDGEDNRNKDALKIIEDERNALTNGIPDAKYPSLVDDYDLRDFVLQVDDVVYPMNQTITMKEAISILESSKESYEYDFDPNETVRRKGEIRLEIKKDGILYFEMLGVNDSKEDIAAKDTTFEGIYLDTFLTAMTNKDAFVNNIYFPGGFRPYKTKNLTIEGLEEMLPGLQNNPVGVVMGLADGHYIIGDDIAYLSIISGIPVGDRAAVKALYLFSVDSDSGEILYMSPIYTREYEGSFDEVDWNVTEPVR